MSLFWENFRPGPVPTSGALSVRLLLNFLNIILYITPWYDLRNAMNEENLLPAGISAKTLVLSKLMSAPKLILFWFPSLLVISVTLEMRPPNLDSNPPL